MLVDVENVGPLVNRLQKFDKDVYKILQREIKAGAEVVADDARTRVPEPALSGWGIWSLATGSAGTRGAVTLVTGSRDLSFDGPRVRTSIKPSVRATRRRGRGTTGIVGRVAIGNAGGAIWSLAGSKSTGSWFTRNLNRKFGEGPWPRALTPALYAKGPQAIAKIDAAIQRAADAVT